MQVRWLLLAGLLALPFGFTALAVGDGVINYCSFGIGLGLEPRTCMFSCSREDAIRGRVTAIGPSSIAASCGRVTVACTEGLIGGCGTPSLVAYADDLQGVCRVSGLGVIAARCEALSPPTLAVPRNATVNYISGVGAACWFSPGLNGVGGACFEVGRLDHSFQIQISDTLWSPVPGRYTFYNGAGRDLTGSQGFCNAVTMARPFGAAMLVVGAGPFTPNCPSGVPGLTPFAPGTSGTIKIEVT